MFICFHLNKLSSDKKGQLVPIFIVVLVILTIMAFVTVNLNKVALFKTESSNAADAGGLAAGSVMANVFNGIAQANSQMEAYYWVFYAVISASFTIATVYLIKAHIDALAGQTAAGAAQTAAGAAMTSATTALTTACANPCAAIAPALAAKVSAATAGTNMTAALVKIGLAIGEMAMFTTFAWGILISVAAFSAAQVYFYGIIRNMAEDGRNSAISFGHKFAFMNSNIGSKLKDGNPDDSLEGAERRNNYRDTFSEFLDNLGDHREYTYRWLDGQERNHFVRVNTDIDPVETFDLKVAVLPSIVEVPLLYMIISSAGAATVSLSLPPAGAEPSYGVADFAYLTAMVSYLVAAAILKAACVCYGCRHAPYIGAACTACYLSLCGTAVATLGVGIGANNAGLAANALGLVANTVAIATISSIYMPLAITWAGLLPGWTFRSSSLESAIPFIITWIEDVVHNRLVTVETTQHHQGWDFGVWETSYPDTTSYSVVNFTGRGKIHDPVLRHDASIVETDNPDIIYDRCVNLRMNIDALEAQIVALNQAIVTLEERAGRIEAEAMILQVAGQVAEANELFKNADLLRDEADVRRIEIGEKEAQIEDIQNTNPDCF